MPDDQEALIASLHGRISGLAAAYVGLVRQLNIRGVIDVPDLARDLAASAAGFRGGDHHAAAEFLTTLEYILRTEEHR